MLSSALVTSLLWVTCSAIPTTSSTLFGYETHYLTDDQAASPVSIKNNTCKVFPGDAAWPSAQDWDRFNQTLNGALIQTVPIAAVCYPKWPQYNRERCDYVTRRWTNSTIHAHDPASVMWPVYQGSSCLPSTPGNNTCTLGGYPNYVVNASTVAHIQLGVKFARENGLRLVIKNSGHDYLGKSNGAGSLSIWTHRLNEIQYLEDYQSTRYRGAAIKMGAGLDAETLYRTAKSVGFTPVSVGGEGHTVGIAGGYLLGGGHSPMSSKHGLSVDQVLSLQVVLANGTFATVTEETDSDLFWALRGSGGSTYGIVTSATSVVYPQTGVTLCTFNFTTGPNVTVDTFWKGFRYYLDYFPEHAEAGIYSYFTLRREGDEYSFLMNPFFAPGFSPAEVQALLQPWFTQLDQLGIKRQDFVLRPYDNIYNSWTDSVVRQEVGGVNRAAGSRLFPRSNWDSESSLDATANALRETVTDGHRVVAYNMKLTPPTFTAPNAANPAFRSALMFAITTTVWDPLIFSPKQILANLQDFASRVLDGWRRVSPGSGAYLSEAVVLEPDFQSSFFGAGPDHYDRLLALKERYDPDDVFYAFRAVGSEKWELLSETTPGFPDQNGRLCRKQ